MIMKIITMQKTSVTSWFTYTFNSVIYFANFNTSVFSRVVIIIIPCSYRIPFIPKDPQGPDSATLMHIGSSAEVLETIWISAPCSMCTKPSYKPSVPIPTEHDYYVKSSFPCCWVRCSSSSMACGYKTHHFKWGCEGRYSIWVKTEEKTENDVIQIGNGSVQPGLHLSCHSCLQIQHCQVSDAQLLIPPAHANLLCAEGYIKFTVCKTDPTTSMGICSGAISQWNTWDSALEQRSVEMDLFAGNSLPIAKSYSNSYKYILIFKKIKMRARERQGDAANILKLKIETRVTKTGTCLCSSNIFLIGGTQLKTNILLQMKCGLKPWESNFSKLQQCKSSVSYLLMH